MDNDFNLHDDGDETPEPEKKPKKRKQKKDEEVEFVMNSVNLPSPSVPTSQPTAFQSIEDLLKIENSNNSGVLVSQAEEEKKKKEERKKHLNELRTTLQDFKSKTTDEYMDIVSKHMIEKGLVMLEAIQKEIEESPKGRDVETAAAMMSAINGIIDNLNKQKIYKQKMDLEERKLAFKQSSSPGNLTANQTNNFIIAGDHSDLIDMIQGKKPFPGQELKEVEVIKDPIVKEDEHEDN